MKLLNILIFISIEFYHKKKTFQEFFFKERVVYILLRNVENLTHALLVHYCTTRYASVSVICNFADKPIMQIVTILTKPVSYLIQTYLHCSLVVLITFHTFV